MDVSGKVPMKKKLIFHKQWKRNWLSACGLDSRKDKNVIIAVSWDGVNCKKCRKTKKKSGLEEIYL